MSWYREFFFFNFLPFSVKVCAWMLRCYSFISLFSFIIIIIMISSRRSKRKKISLIWRNDAHILCTHKIKKKKNVLFSSRKKKDFYVVHNHTQYTTWWWEASGCENKFLWNFFCLAKKEEGKIIRRVMCMNICCSAMFCAILWLKWRQEGKKKSFLPFTTRGADAHIKMFQSHHHNMQTSSMKLNLNSGC